MRLYNVHTLQAAEEVMKNNFSFETEIISIHDAVDRVLACDVMTEIQVPSFRRSTVDGYAVLASDVNGASETMPMLLDLIGSVEMGVESGLTVNEGQTMYVPTGGMVPDGANAMVMIEYTEKMAEDTIAILTTAVPLQNIIGKGADVEKGDTILKQHQRLRPRHIGALAATGVFEVEVYRNLTATVISTGDELITTDQPLNMGEVYDINTYTLTGKLKQFGIEVIDQVVLKDIRENIKDAFRNGIEKSDITIVSGGSSVGEKDYTADIIDELSEKDGVLIHGLAVKPGKPTIVGKVDDKMVLGLPGHPVSAMVVLDQLLRMYFSLQRDTSPFEVKGTLTQNVHAAPGRETFIMVKVEGQSIVPVLGKSGMITMMSKADGYIRIQKDTEGIVGGTEVTAYLFE